MAAKGYNPATRHDFHTIKYNAVFTELSSLPPTYLYIPRRMLLYTLRILFLCDALIVILAIFLGYFSVAVVVPILIYEWYFFRYLRELWKKFGYPGRTIVLLNVVFTLLFIPAVFLSIYGLTALLRFFDLFSAAV